MDNLTTATAHDNDPSHLELEVLDPTGDALVQRGFSFAPRPATLAGKRVGLVWNGKPHADKLLHHVGGQLEARFEGLTTHFFGLANPSNRPHPGELERIIEAVDVVVYASGDCGGCCQWSAKNCVELERAGLPTAVHTTSAFRMLALSAAKAEGAGAIPFWLSAHPVIGASEEKLDAQAKQALDSIVTALTTAPRAVEATPAERKAKTLRFRAKTLAEATDDFNDYLYRMRASDGLPLVPPTRAKVEAMLAGSDLAPQDVVITVYPSGKPVTAEIVATNAVMAGALPAHFPVIIAALKAWSDYHWAWAAITTTGSCAHFVLVSGPIVDQIGINARGNCLSGYGFRPNLAIGRAMQLVFHTVGGGQPGVTDMSMVGLPHTLVGIVCAERTDVCDEIGWPTYSEQRGFRRDQNTVAVATASTGGGVDLLGSGISSSDELFHRLVANFPVLGGAFAGPEGKAGQFIMTPEMARLFAELGATKAEAVQKLLDALAERYHWSVPDALRDIDLMEGTWWNLLSAEEKERWRDQRVRFFSRDPFEWNFLVCGGPGRGVFHFPRNAFVRGESLIMKEIELPKAWDKVLEDSNIVHISMPG